MEKVNKFYPYIQFNTFAQEKSDWIKLISTGFNTREEAIDYVNYLYEANDSNKWKYTNKYFTVVGGNGVMYLDGKIKIVEEEWDNKMNGVYLKIRNLTNIVGGNPNQFDLGYTKGLRTRKDHILLENFETEISVDENATTLSNMFAKCAKDVNYQSNYELLGNTLLPIIGFQKCFSRSRDITVSIKFCIPVSKLKVVDDGYLVTNDFLYDLDNLFLEVKPFGKNSLYGSTLYSKSFYDGYNLLYKLGDKNIKNIAVNLKAIYETKERV